MGKNVSALMAGLVFGFGLVIAEMVNPAKVLAFLDVSGHWDPSLAFVMGAALIVTAVGYRLVWKMRQPVFGKHFVVPQTREIDRRLALGAVLFGIGWGLVGLCPGPAIAALSFGGAPAWIFLGAMSAGVAMFDLSPLAPRRAQASTTR
mgnify:CR=1 FL=1|jgi:uncharacterized membrane protein YedE/YeeE